MQSDLIVFLLLENLLVLMENELPKKIILKEEFQKSKEYLEALRESLRKKYAD